MNDDKPKNKHAAALGKLGGKVGGKSKSTKKKWASKKNGLLGGRPKKVLGESGENK